jgi:hypothetical protein
MTAVELFTAAGAVAAASVVCLGLAKFFAPTPTSAGPTIFDLWLPSRRAQDAARILGVVEVVLAAGALAGLPAAKAGLVAILCVFVAVLSWARLRKVEVSCGCGGASSEASISTLAIGRTAVLASCAALGAAAPDPSASALELSWPAVTLVILATSLLLTQLFSLPTRNAEGRLKCRARAVASGQALRFVRRSPAWRAAQPYLTDRTPDETWRERCWQYLTFQASVAGQDAVAIFAVDLRSAQTLDRVTLAARDSDVVLQTIAG